MISFVLLSLPIFGMVALGWAAVKAQLTPPSALDVLGAFSFRFALPALVIRLIASEPLGRSFNPVFFAGYLASGCLMFALMFAVLHLLQRQRPSVAGARATSATVSNLGFLGPPIVLAFFGERGAGPLAMAIVAEVMILMSVGAAIMAGNESGRVGVGPLILKSTIYNPIIVAIVAGAAIAAAGFALPVPMDRFLALLGASAAPTALFAVGGALAVQRIKRSTGLAAASVTMVKLVIYPLTVWCVLAHVLHIDAFWSGTGVLIASLPSAGSNYVLAQRYAADADQVSAAIVLSTIVSVVTVPWVGWLIAPS
ncbi:AEC family transporter [Bradyrhizobium sp. ARR65]|uniref:AEC family transporter n=1 Tax=Bradyrhizobium sp. ARR65 TaxID=1040989 RepID=UPI000466CE51|nr:AEC family transporter [Bradyrhizobium sp. ARR65]